MYLMSNVIQLGYLDEEVGNSIDEEYIIIGNKGEDSRLDLGSGDDDDPVHGVRSQTGRAVQPQPLAPHLRKLSSAN